MGNSSGFQFLSSNTIYPILIGLCLLSESLGPPVTKSIRIVIKLLNFLCPIITPSIKELLNPYFPQQHWHMGNIQHVSCVSNSTFLCLAFSFPSVPKTQQVLYTRSPERSGMEPPTIVIFRRRETSDSMAVEGDESPPASMSSA
jgi:hypothetical protein